MALCSLSDCDAGIECGFCLQLLNGSCPTNFPHGLQGCQAGDVSVNELCEGSDSCGTSDHANNCEYDINHGTYTQHVYYDIYRRLDCILAPPPPTPPELPVQSPSPPSPPLPPALPSCVTCDAGYECGYCLNLVSHSACPDGPHAAYTPKCNPGMVSVGDLCEGDGGCGTTQTGNNCQYTSDGVVYYDWEIYRREPCAIEPAPPPPLPPPLPPQPTPPPPSPPVPPLPPAPVAPPPSPPLCESCDAGLECGVCLRLVSPMECPDVIHALTYDSCTEAAVGMGVGTFCEGDGQCGTNNGGNNCGFVDGDGHYTLLEFYRVENCTMPPGLIDPMGGGDSALSPDGDGHSTIVVLSALLAAAIIAASLAVLRARRIKRARPSVVLAMPEVVPGGANSVVVDASSLSAIELSQLQVAGTTTGSPTVSPLQAPLRGERPSCRLISTAAA
jgi:hypothetical protein